MKKIYYLPSCNTCQRILHDVKPSSEFELIDIKQNKIDETTLDWIKEKIGSYESLFSKKAMKYRSMNLHLKELTEQDYKKLMLEEYTFLKRPFIISGDQVVVGNTKDAINKAKDIVKH
jgi:arsenate reductase (glutaredoxin)